MNRASQAAFSYDVGNYPNTAERTLLGRSSFDVDLD
jgi:hypothetical protein